MRVRDDTSKNIFTVLKVHDNKTNKMKYEETLMDISASFEKGV